jgi:hypothetical protein
MRLHHFFSLCRDINHSLLLLGTVFLSSISYGLQFHLGLFPFISAHVSLTGIWLATKEVDFEEDEFFHSKGIQPIGQSGCNTLHDRDRRRKQASYNPLRYSTLIITVTLLLSQFILFISQNTLGVRGDLPQVRHVARRGSRSGTGIWQWH